MNLREKFEKETGKAAFQYGGVPEQDYVEWLEKRLEVNPPGNTISGQSYTRVWELLKEARDESDAEGLERVSSGIEILLELINHRCTKHR